MAELSNRQLEIVYRLWPSGELPSPGWKPLLRQACAAERVKCPSRAELAAHGFRFVRSALGPSRRAAAAPRPFRGTRTACPWCANEIVLPGGLTLITAPYCSPGCASLALAYALGIDVGGRRPPGHGWDPPRTPGVLTRHYSIVPAVSTQTAVKHKEEYPPRYVER